MLLDTMKYETRLTFSLVALSSLITVVRHRHIWNNYNSLVLLAEKKKGATKLPGTFMEHQVVLRMKLQKPFAENKTQKLWAQRWQGVKENLTRLCARSKELTTRWGSEAQKQQKTLQEPSSLEFCVWGESNQPRFFGRQPSWPSQHKRARWLFGSLHVRYWEGCRARSCSAGLYWGWSRRNRSLKVRRKSCRLSGDRA